MTYREMLKEIDPRRVDDSKFMGGCAGCPSQYWWGARNLCDHRGSLNEDDCRACWNQEEET